MFDFYFLFIFGGKISRVTDMLGTVKIIERLTPTNLEPGPVILLTLAPHQSQNLASGLLTRPHLVHVSKRLFSRDTAAAVVPWYRWPGLCC